LLRKRVSDFTQKEGVNYYKWDGIQFSCNEPNHGHPVGIYSRRAVMENVIGMVDAVRAKDPDMFLNITSGTWLSPWWVKYANQIWMQGEDYGYADVPSVSPRDAAITYRDLSLYEDFNKNNFWFPIQNLMTHGIIKGNLEKLGGEEEPLDKFTNEALLYLARGVSMWELYISPDILTEGEWNNMSDAILWAKDRFPILSTTEMIGGDPKKRETYGYAHFKGNRGIIAARNPWIETGSLNVELSPAQGLSPEAADLVIEKVYPDKWISPKLYAAGSNFTIPLDGYETAVYEIYPLTEASKPLFAGVPFDVKASKDNSFQLSIFGKGEGAKLLNPEVVQKISANGSTVELDTLLEGLQPSAPAIDPNAMTFTVADAEKGTTNMEFTLDGSVREGTLAVLLVPGQESEKLKLPKLSVTIDGKADTAKFQRGEGHSTWYTIKVAPGKHSIETQIIPRDASKPWSYDVTAWMICNQKHNATSLTFESTKSFTQKPMPPDPRPVGERVVNVQLGTAKLGNIEKHD
jgi:hypothetical protein